MGRSTQIVIGKSEEASYYDFHFDNRTNINSDSKLVME